MCLSVVLPIPDEYKQGEITAWKVIRQHGNRWDGIFFGADYVYDVWIKNSRITPLISEHCFTQYRNGFHCLLSEADAISFANWASDGTSCEVTPVKIRDVVAYGKQKLNTFSLWQSSSMLEVIVANEIYVPLLKVYLE